MVSDRCKLLVKSELDKLGLHHTKVELGEVDVREPLTPDKLARLKSVLMKSGLELMDDKKAILVERIKCAVKEMLEGAEEPDKVNFSDLLSEKLNHNYTYLAGLFSEATGITIERYLIVHKIERVKELILYDNLSLTEISYRLNYSSVAHLSGQFKKVTGLTPTYYRKLKALKHPGTDNV